MVDKSVVTAVRQNLKVLDEQGFTVRFGVVFGSQATGKAGRWSDIDLLVVSPVLIEIARREGEVVLP